MNHNVEFEESSGNIYADLEIENAEELNVRAQIGFHVTQIIEQRSLKQKETAELFGIKQPEVSHLMNGHYSRFTTDKLLEFLRQLNQKVTIEISPHQDGEPYHNVALAFADSVITANR